MSIEIKMENNRKVKNLLCGLAATTNPFFLVSEMIFSEWPKIRRFIERNGNTINLNEELFGQGKYDGAEFMLVGIFDNDWDIREDKILSYKKSKVPSFSFHGCYENFPKRYKNIYLNLAENCSTLTKKAIHSHIEAVSRLQTKKSVLVFHPGIIKKGNNRKKAFQNVISNLKDNINYAQEKNVVVCIENMPWGWGSGIEPFCNEATDLKYILDAVNHPSLKVTFDWGHLNSYLMNPEFRSKYYKKNEYCLDFRHIKGFVDILGKEIAHMHVHYNRCHLPKYKKFRKGVFKKYLTYLIFWTNLSQFIRKEKNKYFYDEHLTLDLIKGKYVKGFEKSINYILDKSSIREHGFITHEYTNKKIFRLFSLTKDGLYEGYLESLQIFKDMIEP
jgi:sugar phosphate isomerase/epimerase